MANEFDDFFEELLYPSPPVEDLLFGSVIDVDMRAQELFMQSVFDNDDRAYRELVDYMWERYHIDFEDAFQWEDFREWYDADRSR
jgi:hypothetical protein